MYWIRDFITGFLIGLANLIPGVSGGTFALILGVYERLITFFSRITSKKLLEAIHLALDWIKSGCAVTQGKLLWTFIKEHDGPFMAILLLGTISSILTLSSLMKALLLDHFTLTYGYFFGLIIPSVLVPWQMLKKPRAAFLLPVLAGVFLTVALTMAVDPYEKAVHKSALLKNSEQQQINLKAQPNQDSQQTRLHYIGKYSSAEYLYIFVCGAIAISAMVLPGISGSLVLILLGQYFAVISAIANIKALLVDDLFFLGIMALGIVFGMLSFARCIKYALQKWHDPVMSFLVGLILGSLYTLWPFKEAHLIEQYYLKEGARLEIIENFAVHSNVNILPQDTASAVLTLAAVIAGIVTMWFFLLVNKRYTIKK